MRKLILLAEKLDTYSINRFHEEASNLGIEYTNLNPKNFILDLHDNKDLSDTVVLHRTTGISYDDYDLSVASYLRNCGATILNDVEVLKSFRSKLDQHLFFQQHHLNALPIVSYRGKLSATAFDKITDELNCSRYILKMERGNQGIGVNVLDSKESLKSILDTFCALKDQRFIIQPFITGTEYRLLFANGKLLGAIEKSKSSSDFRKNAHFAPAKSIAPSAICSSVMNLGQRCYTESRAFIAGIDIALLENGEALILECNMVPGFELMEKATGQNIARAILGAI